METAAKPTFWNSKLLKGILVGAAIGIGLALLAAAFVPAVAAPAAMIVSAGVPAATASWTGAVLPLTAAHSLALGGASTAAGYSLLGFKFASLTAMGTAITATVAAIGGLLGGMSGKAEMAQAYNTAASRPYEHARNHEQSQGREPSRGQGVDYSQDMNHPAHKNTREWTEATSSKGQSQGYSRSGA